MSKWEIMQRVAATRKEIETFAQDWADVMDLGVAELCRGVGGNHEQNHIE